MKLFWSQSFYKNHIKSLKVFIQCKEKTRKLQNHVKSSNKLNHCRLIFCQLWIISMVSISRKRKKRTLQYCVLILQVLKWHHIVDLQFPVSSKFPKFPPIQAKVVLRLTPAVSVRYYVGGWMRKIFEGLLPAKNNNIKTFTAITDQPVRRPKIYNTTIMCTLINIIIIKYC